MLDSSGGVGFMLTVGLVVSLVGLVLVLVLIERPKTMLAWTHKSTPIGDDHYVIEDT
jgi:hypothetical protein